MELRGVSLPHPPCTCGREARNTLVPQGRTKSREWVAYDPRQECFPSRLSSCARTDRPGCPCHRDGDTRFEENHEFVTY